MTLGHNEEGDTMKLDLTIAEVNAIMQALGNMPYAELSAKNDALEAANAAFEARLAALEVK